MRLAWLSDGETEHMARYSDDVLGALRGRCHVTAWCLSEGDVRLDSVPTDPKAWARLVGFDMCIYHVGSGSTWESLIVELARAYPGVVVVHPSAGHRMDAVAGLRRHAVVQEALAGALGAVLHPPGGALLRRFAAGPTFVTPLPAEKATPTPTDLPLRTDGRSIVLVTAAGGPESSVTDVVSMLSRHPALAARTRFLVAGDCGPGAYADELRERITRGDLADTVRLLGPLDGDALARGAAVADVGVRLVAPGSGAADTWRMSELAWGLPTVVYDSGPFSGLPDDAVVKVRPGDIDALARAVSELVADPQRRSRLGRRGQRHASAHGPGAYAARLLGFIEMCAGWQLARGFATDIGGHLRELGLVPGDADFDLVVRESVELLDPMV